MNRIILVLTLLLLSSDVCFPLRRSHTDSVLIRENESIVIAPKYSGKTGDNRYELEQSDFIRENTEYVIKYDFFLRENITIPANCTLKFEGGSISGGGNNNIIEGNNTYIKAGNNPIFDNVYLLGNCYGADEYTYNICWFKGNSFSDKWYAVRKSLQTNRPYTLLVPEAKYGMEGTVVHMDTKIQKNAASNMEVSWNIDRPITFLDTENQSIIKCMGEFLVTKSMDDVFVFGDEEEKPEYITFPYGIFVRVADGVTIKGSLMKFTSVARIKFDGRVDLHGQKYNGKVNCGVNVECNSKNSCGDISIDYLYLGGFTDKALRVRPADGGYTQGNIFINAIKCESCTQNTAVVYVGGRNSNVSIGNLSYSDINNPVKSVCVFEITSEKDDQQTNNFNIGTISVRNSIVKDGYVINVLNPNKYKTTVKHVRIGTIVNTENNVYEANIVNASDWEIINSDKVNYTLGDFTTKVHIVKSYNIINDSGRNNTWGMIQRTPKYSDLILGRTNNGSLIYADYENGLWARVRNTGNKTKDLIQITPPVGNSNKRQRLYLTVNDAGFAYYDTTLNKLLHWNGSKWIEEDGAAAGVKRSGKFSQRPNVNDIYPGYQYFNTDTHRTITWAEGKWWNPDGTEARR